MISSNKKNVLGFWNMFFDLEESSSIWKIFSIWKHFFDLSALAIRSKQHECLSLTNCSKQFPVSFITMTLPDGKNDNTNKLLQMKISLSCLASRALSRLILYHPLNDSLGFLHFSEYQPIIITSNLRPTYAGRKMGKL